jgi:hypothetical protein
MLRRGTAVLLGAGVLLAAACRPAARPAPTPAVTPTPGATATPASTPTAAPTASPTTPQDLTAYLPPGPGRDLVILYCSDCHSVARPLVTRKSPQAWADFLDSHSGTQTLSPDVLQALIAYFAANFGPNNPTPNLPPELLQW